MHLRISLYKAFPVRTIRLTTFLTRVKRRYMVMGSNTPGANSPRSNFFRGCTVTIICLFLIILGVIIAITCAIFASAFWGTLILYLVTVGSIIVPVILWLIDKTNPRVDDWLKKGDKFLENL